MKQDNKEIEKYRIKHPAWGFGYKNNGAFLIPYENVTLQVIASDGEGWDHVSISLSGRCPTWEEMNFIKDLFFKADETVIQYHPRKTKYVNLHLYCLHLWKKQGCNFALPPVYMV